MCRWTFSPQIAGFARQRSLQGWNLRREVCGTRFEDGGPRFGRALARSMLLRPEDGLDPHTLQTVYQRADEETMYEVVVGGGELREAKGS